MVYVLLVPGRVNISISHLTFLDLPLDSYFVRTQSTEALSTYVATSSIACSIFVFALIIHQIGCFSLPSCYGTTGAKYIRFFHLSGSRCSLFLFLTPNRVVPNVWDFFHYFMGATTKSLMIKLQPKIYDHILLTVRISFIPSVCSLVPVILISLPENRALSVETSSNNRRFFVLVSLLTAALSTPPDIGCQILAIYYYYSNRVCYLCGIDAYILEFMISGLPLAAMSLVLIRLIFEWHANDDTLVPLPNERSIPAMIYPTDMPMISIPVD